MILSNRNKNATRILEVKAKVEVEKSVIKTVN
jgi:hypothetical protein